MTNSINKKATFIISSIIVVLIISLGVVSVISVIRTKEIKISSNQQKKCPKDYVKIPGNKKYNTNDFCVMKYEAKDGSGKAASFAESKPWTNVSQLVALDLSKYACDKCHLITENEWMTIAQNLVSNSDNWNEGKVGDGYIYSGHNDNAPANTLAAVSDDKEGYFGTVGNINSTQKRTLKLSNGETIWDFAGNAAEWTDAQMTGGQPGTIEGEKNYSWKEWNQLGFNGYLPIKPFPSQYNNLNYADNWDYKNGIGRLFSNSGDETLKTFIRGGSYQDGESAGVFSLNISGNITEANPLVGFRVATSLK